ncbi:hypothetical protein AB3M83_12660 [Microbacterium sp. 179-B 1A2 NHS]|uniref:hypothetical protein n=1 Tax=Microbacterium sp. 179-B 1A2 NHS TaxID=3142383 RepID=UPI0039A260E3
MSQRGSALARQRILLGARVWWDAVTGGAFFTRASALFALLLSMTILAPNQHFETGSGYVDVGVVGFVSGTLLVIALVPVAFAERAVQDRRSRAVMVLGAVLLASVARPYVNEGLFVVLYDVAPAGDIWPDRALSNILIWMASLSIIAMTIRSAELTRGTRGRLTHAVATLEHGRRRLARFDQDNRAMLAELTADLRAQRDRMLTGTIDFAAVRDYSNTVRAASHRLEERAQLSLRLVEVAGEESAPVESPRPSALALLQPPPFLLVGVVFFVGALPYAYGVGGMPSALAAVAAGVPITVLADCVSRVFSEGLSERDRGIVIVATWLGAGILMTMLAHQLVDTSDPSRFVPLLSLPLVAIALAACADAINRAAVSARRLEAVLGMVARTVTRRTAQARRPLRHAAHVLHGRVQGRCVILAAHADEWEVTDAEIETFRRETDAAFDSVHEVTPEADADGREAVQSAHEELSELLATWSSVLDVTSTITDAAAEVLDDEEISRRVATVVNEGFVNAVKHSDAKSVWLSIDVVGATLAVRTWSIGELDHAPGAAVTSRRVTGLGDGARVFQRGEHVVLEVSLPVLPAGAPGEPDTDAAGAAGRLGRKAFGTRIR